MNKLNLYSVKFSKIIAKSDASIFMIVAKNSDEALEKSKKYGEEPIVIKIEEMGEDWYE